MLRRRLTPREKIERTVGKLDVNSFTLAQALSKDAEQIARSMPDVNEEAFQRAPRLISQAGRVYLAAWAFPGVSWIFWNTMPGVDKNGAAIIIAELGVGMSVFPSDKHCASWAGVSPGSKESAGKKGRTKAVHGNKALRDVLCECAWAASRKRGSHLAAKYWRLVRCMGEKKAIFSIGHSLLTIAYHILKDLIPYKELGPDYAEKNKPNHINLMIKKLYQSWLLRDPES